MRRVVLRLRIPFGIHGLRPNADAVMARCPRCATPSETPIGCLACGALFPLESDPDPFECLGLPPAFRVDPSDLKRRLLRYSRLSHPDFFATAGEDDRRRAERATAVLNGAYAVLSDDARRAEWLVEHLGGPDENEERAMPREFLVQVLEWNETLESARMDGSIGAERLTELRLELEERRERAMVSVAGLLDPLPERGSAALREARQALNAVRYVDRALAELEAVRLSRAETR